MTWRSYSDGVIADPIENRVKKGKESGKRESFFILWQHYSRDDASCIAEYNFNYLEELIRMIERYQPTEKNTN